MTYPEVIPAFDFREMVIMSGDKVITTSLKGSDYFGKSHKNYG